PTSANYVITNTRVGKIQVQVTKDPWKIGELAGYTATFELYANDVSIGTQTLAQSATEPTITFGDPTGLEKYDKNGAIISYTVKETKLTDSATPPKDYLFSGGVA
ncbi:MAG: Cna B-type domain-containing protein, partial [Clostridia bacterium]